MEINALQQQYFTRRLKDCKYETIILIKCILYGNYWILVNETLVDVEQLIRRQNEGF